MTSSLVGSEMCIRDRVFLAGGGANRPPKQRDRRGLPWKNRRVHHVHNAVSYTHLTLPTICSV
eukprot:6767225-Prorocentrum_lima.AAC.1